MLPTFLRKVVEGQSLTEAEAYQAMHTIMAGEATPAQIAGFLIALRMKGETVEEIAGFVRAMREKAVKVPTQRRPLVDTCGTGGDRLNTFNISTATAFVVAGAGVAVAKHGNRSVSSQAGSADVLEALGVRLDMPPEEIGACIDEIGIGFLFAPALHPAMKYAIGPRREMGVRTVFNILGPLTNPAGATRQILGVFAPEWTEPLAEVLGRLGAERAMVVHGLVGMDEISTIGPTRISEWKGDHVETYLLHPRDVGLPEAREEDLAGSDPATNARWLWEVLEGRPGPRLDIVLLNAAAALQVAGVAGSWEEGWAQAREAIETGEALRKLEELRARSRPG